jgi:hypothetical protein
MLVRKSTLLFIRCFFLSSFCGVSSREAGTRHRLTRLLEVIFHDAFRANGGLIGVEARVSTSPSLAK